MEDTPLLKMLATRCTLVVALLLLFACETKTNETPLGPLNTGDDARTQIVVISDSPEAVLGHRLPWLGRGEAPMVLALLLQPELAH